MLHGGRRLALDGDGLTIGRRSENDVVLQGDLVSRHHARIGAADGSWFVADLDSMNGTFLNGQRLRGESHWLASGDTISVGGEALRFLAGDRTHAGLARMPLQRAQAVQYRGGRLSLGRDPSNDVVLDDPNVSRFHAEVVPRPTGVELRDLGSSNGTRVNGQLVGAAPVETGAEIGIGPFRILFDGSSFRARNDRGALRLDASAVSVEASGVRILADVTVSVGPGQLVAIIGESGAGKSTLIKALAGVSLPTGGSVTVSGEPVRARLTDIGYVPQDEIVHGSLTVREALRYSARLRLPEDALADDVERSVKRVLAEVDLEEHADTRIARLSGGQRKRAGVAVELLSRPSLLFLDEPTTGLDPELETRMMGLLRRLANNQRAVTVVTHATKNLGACDRLVVMGRGGELSFFGTPADALEFFGVDSYDDIYRALKDTPSSEWRRLYETGPLALAGGPAPLQAAADQRVEVRRRVLPQARVLASRYVRLLSRDRRNLLILLGQVPLLALGMAGLFKAGVFAHGKGHAGNSAQLLFLLVTTSIWLGSIDSAREVVKERSVFVRESAAGVRLGAYILSKAAVLFSVAAAQTLALTAIVLLLRPLHEPAGSYLRLGLTLMVTSAVAVSLGLLISSVVRSQDQATSFIPLALIPQLFFAGAIVPVERMGGLVSALSAVIPAQWSFAGSGTAIDMNARIAADPPFAHPNSYGQHFFDVSTPLACLTLAVFGALLLGAAALALKRRHA
jgi:ABC-type multidrug transport system ATPase subunit/pSer/pThr/pTyr-binding forkhead associated (FHA) protein/ABC-type multidrug transport system permease subunit